MDLSSDKVTAAYFTGIKHQCKKHGSYYNMKQFIIAAAILSAASMPAFAQTGQNPSPQNPGQKGQNYVGAPGPLMGAGLPGLVLGGVGYGVYWLVKRRRRKTTEV